MKRSTTKWSMRILATFGFMLVASACILFMSGTANADGCRTTDVGMNNGTNTNQWAHFSAGSVDYWYTDPIRSPNWATTCKDVNINHVSVPGDTYGGQCVHFRAVRQWDGKTDGWKLICPGSGWRVIFSGIHSSTYRVEAKPLTNPNYRPYYTIKD